VDLADSVRQSVQIEEVVHFGKERLPAGPNINDSDAIIVVEGRSDVLNLLKYGIKNVIAVEGTNVPQTIVDLSKEKVVTAFVDGDRGGELILRELLQVAEIDFIARAPAAQEVEELTQKQIVKCLRNKVPADQFAEMLNIPQPQKNGDKGRGEERGERSRRDEDRGGRHGREREREREQKPAPPRPPMEEKAPAKRLSPEQIRYKSVLEELNNSSKAKLLNAGGNVLKEVHVSLLADTLKEGVEGVTAVILDGIITQRILDIAVEKNITAVVGVKLGNIAKLPTNVEIFTKEDLT
jgi:DNA primase